MPTKRQLLVTALVAIVLTTSGCSALQGGANVDAEQVIERTQDGMADMESFTFDAHMAIDSAQAGQPINITAEGAVDVAAAEGRADVTSIGGQSTTAYLVNETLYLKSQGVWQKMTLQNATATQGVSTTPQAGMGQFGQLGNATDVTFEGNTTIDGTDVYELSVALSEEQIQEAMAQQNGPMTSMVSMEDVSYTVYVTHDTHRLKRFAMSMDASMAAQSMTIDAQVTLDDFDEDIRIDLPDAARNAEPMGQQPV